MNSEKLHSFWWWPRFERLIYFSHICSSILFPAYLLLVAQCHVALQHCRYQQSNPNIANINATQWDAHAMSTQKWKDRSVFRRAGIPSFLSIHCTIAVSVLLPWNSQLARVNGLKALFFSHQFLPDYDQPQERPSNWIVLARTPQLLSYYLMSMVFVFLSCWLICE